jgi:hypothetical protein
MVTQGSELLIIIFDIQPELHIIIDEEINVEIH